MAKPWQHHNGPNIYEGSGNEASEAGGEGEAVDTEKEGIGGTQGDETKDPPPRRRADRQKESHEAREEGKRRRQNMTRRGKRWKGTGTERPHGGTGRVHMHGGRRAPPRGKRGPPGITPRTCAPVVAGSIWRLPASQQWVAPGRENCGQRCMAASLAPACSSVSKLVCYALRNSGAPFYGNLGRGMTGGSQ